MASNDLLHKARVQRRDEFYTQYDDIEKELRYYQPHFEGKTVYCNCDDPYESNFFKYFANNFNSLGLKRLITTSYAGSLIVGEQLSLDDIEGLEGSGSLRERVAYQTDIREVSAVGLSDVEHLLRHDANTAGRLNDDGDFRSPECTALLREADIVVTNPPFSLFREYLEQLIEHNKKFIILGNINATSYKEVFLLLKANQLWLGPSITSGDREFRVPSDYPLTATSSKIDEHGNKYLRVKGVRWFTNLDHNRRRQELLLSRSYAPQAYPHYDNYDAINVDKVKHIPRDWKGAMGVPITFLDKYNPDQFEILDANNIRNSQSIPFKKHGLIKDKDGTVNGVTKYVRIVIRHKGI